ncbi:calcium-activated chloride channel regulator 1-like isoform X8 [Eriocheir sinensis]|uniref:calcium-activated chloride channel regulator 1-like isoform X8 n=1 Tax=Eriocheir sinensis TaxID=95602 RepID=UPI0021C784CD|nr:calcium-activated chloride channel regulator 1-like isoform X8 [Eriocheir sinensis]
MRWSAWVGVAVVAAALGWAAASTRNSVVGQGYEEVVVGISPLLDESQAEKVIPSLKKVLNETSQALFKATGNKLFFRKVKILVPSTWRNIAVDQAATSESYENSDLRVDLKNPVYGDQVYTVQPGGCGEPGQYIHLTPTYLTHPAAEDVWGPRGKVLAQAWARLRWGVFDEVGYPADNRFPLFYRTWNEEHYAMVRPNYCADEKIRGKYKDRSTQGSCRYVDGFPDDNCRFVPDSQQTATTSLMSFTTLDSIEKFCTDGSDATGSHNSEAPNRQNLMCEGRSAAAVIADHQDFLNTTPLSGDHNVAPEVLVVQEVPAKFALVLDYSSSMSGTRITNLVNTAKRWILNDVADGSFVSIINFSDGATVVRSLTEVSNSTRDDLASVITTNTGGYTCIGCGLNKALEQLKNQNNKVILLISDGGENRNPKIDAVMSAVVQSGARVISIAYGTRAEEKMERLAQNTGGKAYIVPEYDDGSFMDDAFQGSLTYQPGQSITNIDIKIYEEVNVPLKGTVANGTFVIDSTVGRNLEFRLDTSQAIQSSGPYLVSPTGQNHTDAIFTSTLNLWTIRVGLAESGTWTWTMSVSPSSASATVTVTAQARDPETLPIFTESWMNTGVDYVNATHQPVIVYARVTQGSKPVVGAKVRAYITTPNANAAAVELDLLDNGNNADVQAGDGTYSRYFTQFVATGRYAVKAQVWDDGSSYINNGFITSRRSARRSRSAPLALARLAASEQLDVNEQCCGSVIPFNPDTATKTGEFTRTTAAGSFNVVELPVGGDAFPPARVLDLRTYVRDTTTLTLNWTAPGDDYDTGVVSGYEIRMSDNMTALTGDLSDNSTISLLDLETSSNMTELLKEAGKEVTLEVTLEEPLKQGSLYFVALQAVDDVGNKSPVSGLASLAAPAPPSVDDRLEGWAIALIVVGCVVGVVLLVGAGYIIYKKYEYV